MDPDREGQSSSSLGSYIIDKDTKADNVARSLAESLQKHPNIFLSASPVVLHESHPTSPTGDPPSLPPLFTSACSPGRILLESDSPDLRTCEEGMWKVVGALASGRGWKVEETWPSAEDRAIVGREKGVVEILEDNWTRWMADDP